MSSAAALLKRINYLQSTQTKTLCILTFMARWAALLRCAISARAPPCTPTPHTRHAHAPPLFPSCTACIPACFARFVWFENLQTQTSPCFFLSRTRRAASESAEALSTQDAQCDAKQMKPACVNVTVHTASNIKGFALEFARARPVWMRPYLSHGGILVVVIL